MLTKAELDLTSKLAQCFNDWCAINGHHPMDRSEFATNIHVLQNMVMARSAARDHPDHFPHILHEEG